MNKYIIRGNIPLSGEINISGSKNSTLPILASSLLTQEDMILYNVPILKDVQTMISLLAMLGKKVIIEPNRIIIRAIKQHNNFKATYEIVKQMRASIVVLGPLLAMWKKAEISLPGGCAFGPRPIDLHLHGFRELGAKIELSQGGYLIACASQLRGKHINLLGDFGPSVLGTDNIAMAATLAEGRTIIENAAQEPETEDLINCLKKMGAKIEGGGTSRIVIDGQERLSGCEYTIIQDRIEALTFIAAAVVTKGNVTLNYSYPEHIESPLKKLLEIGVDIKVDKINNTLSIKGADPKNYKGLHIHTLPYPNFPTDAQAIFMSIACFIGNSSLFTEGIYQNRFNHAFEMNRLGADITIEKETAFVKRSKSMQGASIQASDLRAGAALVIVGLGCRGITEVYRIYHIERGYEAFHNKLKLLGANIEIAKTNII